MSDMEKLAGSGRQVILLNSFEDLTKRIVEEFKSKFRGKFGLLRKEQPLQHTRHIVCYIAFKACMVKGGTSPSIRRIIVNS